MTTQNNISPICPPKWVWLLAGFAIGMFSSFLVYLQFIHAPQDEVQIQTSSNQKTGALVKTADSENLFEEILPAPDKPSTVSTQYVLQVGSFRKEQQAEGLKNYLVSLAITATIKKTSLADTGIWYQVQIGPFSDLNTLNKTRTLLTKNKIPVILKEL